MTTIEPLSRSDLLPIAASQKTLASVGRPGRIEFLGATRGAAILYIVFNHIIDYVRQLDLSASSLWDGAIQVYTKFDFATAGTRLPILILMTGLFLERSLARGTGRFIASRTTSLLWPLILWGLVQAVIFSFNPELTPWRGQQEREGLILLGTSLASFEPVWAFYAWSLVSDQLWFLNMLAVFLLLYLFARRLPRALLFSLALILFVVSIALNGPLAPKWSPALWILTRLGPFFLFFVLGTMMSDWVVKRGARTTRTHAIIAGCLFLAIAAPLLFADPAVWWPLTFVSALPAIPLLFMAGNWLAKSPARAFFLWAGQASLLLLCLHTLCIVFVLAIALAIGVTSPPLLALLAAVGGIGLCFLIDHALRRTGLSAALGFRPI
jgi:fucose 4-O-acetylase-like acetyltransferase